MAKEQKKNNSQQQFQTSHNNKPPLYKDRYRQLNLDGESVSVPQKYHLCDNGYLILETFYLVGPGSNYSLFHLKNLFNGRMHPNTIYNRLNDLLSRGFIRELPIIPKSIINSLYCYRTIPPKLEDGTIVRDSRQKFYAITEEGMKIFELNKSIHHETQNCPTED